MPVPAKRVSNPETLPAKARSETKRPSMSRYRERTAAMPQELPTEMHGGLQSHRVQPQTPSHSPRLRETAAKDTGSVAGSLRQELASRHAAAPRRQVESGGCANLRASPA